MIKYNENFAYSSGGFVTNKGNVIFLSSDYEQFAMEYCLGSNCNMIDSELSVNELEMFKLWVIITLRNILVVMICILIF